MLNISVLFQDIDEAELPNYEQNVSDVLALIPSLPKGLDVNIHFTGFVVCFSHSVLH